MLHIGPHVEFIFVLPAIPPGHGLLPSYPRVLDYLKVIFLWGYDQAIETGDLRRRTRSRAGGCLRPPPVDWDDGDVSMYFS